ncbi:DUF550 domain-containing protein [Cronobacter sakazakii]|uniref:DUF550 domain-containing protein n=1 Tax=Cronobacter sakazakii TaxID=28141 RepID=UPI003A87E746
MSTITREQLLERAREKVKSLEFAVTQTAFADSRAELEEELELARIALASLEAEAVCVIDQPNLDYLKSGSDADVWPASRTEMGDVLLYRTAPPAPVSVPAAMEIDDDFDSAFEHGKAVGWNAYRAAMLQAEPVSNSDELPLDYLQGHKDGLEWAAQLAEANHPQTGDWLYDDPIDLARAIRKGPDMPTVQGGNSPVIPDEVLSAIRKVARIRTDFDHFDGDRRGIGDCLDEAEQELIVTINKYASQLAAEPIATNDVREQQTAVPPIQADVAQAIENLKQKLVECNRYNYCADAVKNVEDACHAAMLQGSQPVSKREQVRREHAEWSDKTFGDVGPVGPLKHLSKEALEAAAEPDDLSEWADMQFLLWDAQRRAGISDGEITAAMEEKLKVNMARQWPEPKDGEPRQHLKPAPQTVPDSVISAAVNGIMATYADNAEDCREMVRTHVEQACRAAIQESGHG